MNAVICFSGIFIEISLSAFFSPYDAAEQLAAHSEELARLEERERIGMDLHDGAIQRLYGLVLALGARQVAGGASAADIAEAIDRINAVIREIRNCVLDLRLHNLEAHGLRAGIQALAQEVRTNTPIRPRIEFVGDDASLSPTVKRQVLQLVRARPLRTLFAMRTRRG